MRNAYFARMLPLPDFQGGEGGQRSGEGGLSEAADMREENRQGGEREEK